MTFARALLPAIALGFWAAIEAAAQGFGPPPGQSSLGAPAPMQAPGGQAENCGTQFLPLRQEADRRAGLVKAAGERKAPRPERCELFKSFSAAENAMLKYVENNQSWCAIPPQIVTQIKTSHSRTTQITKQVCSNAVAAPSQPPPPSLSEALGTTRVPDASTTRTGRGGTFNTLTGNPLAR